MLHPFTWKWRWLCWIPSVVIKIRNSIRKSHKESDSSYWDVTFASTLPCQSLGSTCGVTVMAPFLTAPFPSQADLLGSWQIPWNEFYMLSLLYISIKHCETKSLELKLTLLVLFAHTNMFFSGVFPPVWQFIYSGTAESPLDFMSALCTLFFPQLVMISALIPETCFICLCGISIHWVCFFYKIKWLAKSFMTEYDTIFCQRLLWVWV